MAILTLLAVVTPIVLFRRGRAVKQLAYEVRIVNVVRVASPATDKITILYEGQPVADAQLITVELTNQGNTAIASTDFEVPITVHLGSATLLSLELGAVSPPELAPEITETADGFMILPVLLNPRDSLTVSVVATEVDDITVHARIVGVRRLQDAAPPRQQRQKFIRVGTAVLGVALALGLGTGLTALLDYIQPPKRASQTPIIAPDVMDAIGTIFRLEFQPVMIEYRGGSVCGRVKAIRDDQILIRLKHGNKNVSKKLPVEMRKPC